MSAPFPPDPLATVTALLSLPRFGLFTSICEVPKSSDAARFSDDMIAVRAATRVEFGERRLCCGDFGVEVANLIGLDIF